MLKDLNFQLINSKMKEKKIFTSMHNLIISIQDLNKITPKPLLMILCVKIKLYSNNKTHIPITIILKISLKVLSTLSKMNTTKTQNITLPLKLHKIFSIPNLPTQITITHKITIIQKTTLKIILSIIITVLTITTSLIQ
jgi:hypothetical protein